MTIRIENVDDQLLQALKSMVALRPNAFMTQEQSQVDTIKEELQKDIELYRQGKLEIVTLDELKEHCSQW
ncbi:MAG: hypothetical protein CR967_02545 [Proteobacteria bacterium]|nr:MAG: hypothetical protein CR967_02545 [Pseudomonadota bacterium]